MARSPLSRVGFVTQSLGVYQFTNALRRDVRLRLFLGSALVGLLILMADRRYGINLSNATAPSGLLTLEFSNDAFVTKAIISSWDQSEHLYAAYRLGLGLVLWLFVVVAMTSGCLWASQELRFTGHAIVRAGRTLAWLQIVAGAFHVAGTVTLIEVLIDVTGDVTLSSLGTEVNLVWVCSVVKYSILASGWLYLAAVPLGRAVRPRETNPDVRRSKGWQISQ